MRFAIAILLMEFSFLFAKPMESIERYNVILVHGAADSLQGIDCLLNYPKAPYFYWDTIADTLRRIEGYEKYSLLGEKWTMA